MSAGQPFGGALPGFPLLAGGFPALAARPELYPGIPETLDHPDEIGPWPRDYFLHEDALWRLLPAGRRPLGEAALEAIPGPQPDPARPAPVEPRPHGSRSTTSTALNLDRALLSLGVPGPAERLPAVAIGSNAYPRQLADKLRGTPAGMAVPSFRGVLLNARIVYCPRKARKGYVPVTPFYSPGAASVAWLQLLTPAQLEIITRTEGTYRLLRCRPESGGVSFLPDASRQPLSEMLVYWYGTAFAPGAGGIPPACRGTASPPDGEGLAQQELWRFLGPAGPDAPELERGAVPNPIPPNSVDVGTPGTSQAAENRARRQ